MKKNFKYAWLGAIALTGAMGFTACSTDNDVAETISNNNSNTKEIPVNFVFNVATSNGTRMSSANTQAALTETFRGINTATLMTFSQKNGTNLNDGKSLAAAATAAKSYDFGTVLGAGALDPDGDGSSAPKSRRVLELSLPSETNTLLFWGKAIKTGTSQQQGSVTWNINKDLSQISFTADRRIPAGSGAGGEDAYFQNEKLIAALLTKLVDSRADYTVSYGGTSYSVTNFGWKDYVTMEGTTIKRKETLTWGGESHDITPLGEIMADAFIAMNTFYSGETRAGSGPAVAKTLGDLYDVLQSVAGVNPTSGGEALTKAVAGALQSTIGNMIDTSGKTWKTELSGLKTLSGLASTETNLVTEDLNNFPHISFNVPQGATVLQITIENSASDADRTFTYSYNNSIPAYAMHGDVTSTFNPINYRYPVELCYFGNSPIRVSNTPHETNNYPDGVTNWDTDGSWASDWTKNSHVYSTTRSVAMQQNINYGTALLKTTVRYGANVLNDNNHNIQNARRHVDEADNTITVSSSTFSLTGVLVGGVEPEVGWNYIAKAASPTFSSYIYDNDLPSVSIPTYNSNAETGKSTPNYTLVWDNWNVASQGNKQNVVYIALEFVNNSGKDFWGMHNLIRNGQTFYITGKLDPDAGLSETDRSAGITWPGTGTGTTGSPYALPPYAADGSTIQERRIFIQDYMTTADFVIGENSLQAALVDVPDLRSSQISLGLSVDLKWQTGLNFSEVFLGQ